ncbi:MAG: DUF5715 family protein [Candidatus Amulumruptor caecigallinarius]|nr:DUF5715 family protein [Candidatus Amulumruptor caecigallinarius]
MNTTTLIIIAISTFSLGWAGCSRGGSDDRFDTIGEHSNYKLEKPSEPAWMQSNEDSSSSPSIESQTPMAEEISEEEAPRTITEPGYISRPNRPRVMNLGRLADVFNDSNKYQYESAEKIGISPLKGIRDAYFTRRPLVKIKSCEYYELDSLTHSMPYLVPEAAELLNTIGRNFNDMLRERGVGPHRIRVTSVLRSPLQVKKLRRINRNATDSSTHQFATTFDITYARFHCLDERRKANDEDLKNILAEVIHNLHKRGKCKVKYEIKSPCFHITATGK